MRRRRLLLFWWQCRVVNRIVCSAGETWKEEAEKDDLYPISMYREIAKPAESPREDYPWVLHE